MPLPPLARFLDPRSDHAHLEPIADSVRIPVGELPNRVHELPSRQRSVVLADVGETAVEASRILDRIGREAEVSQEWKFGSTGPARLWSPNGFLMRVAEELSPGMAIDLGCGSGRDAVALAGSGWNVCAVDRLPDALALGKDLARRYLEQPERGAIEWRCSDLESGVFELPHGADLITMAWYLNRPLIRAAAKALACGGSLVLETFTAHHREIHGKPRAEAFVLQEGELQDLPLDVRIYETGWHDGRHSSRVWLVRTSD